MCSICFTNIPTDLSDYVPICLINSGPRAIIVTPQEFFFCSLTSWLAVPWYPAPILTPAHSSCGAQTPGFVFLWGSQLIT